MNIRKKFALTTAIAGAALALSGIAVAPGAAGATKPVTTTTVASTLGGDTITSHNTNGYSTGECNSTEWHWVITGISPQPATSDVPATITVTWSSGPATVIPLDNVTGGVAHYRYTGHLDDGVVPTGASAVWPNGTTATSYNQFNLSHGPCAPKVTTTTAAATTTTAEVTTTTAEVTTTTEEVTTTTEEVTTTTEEVTTTTAEETTTTAEATTTSLDSEGPTTTVAETSTTAEETTTTLGGQSGGPTTTAASSGPTTTVLSGELPTTGAGQTFLVVLGLAMVFGGLLFLALGRRPDEA